MIQELDNYQKRGLYYKSVIEKRPGNFLIFPCKMEKALQPGTVNVEPLNPGVNLQEIINLVYPVILCKNIICLEWNNICQVRGDN